MRRRILWFFFHRLLAPTCVGEEHVSGQCFSSITLCMSQPTTHLYCGQSRNQSKTFRLGLFLEELWEMRVMPQMSQRQWIPPPSASTMVEDQQQRDPSTKKWKFSELCTDKKKQISSTCNKCGKHICDVHTFTYCSSCREWIPSHSLSRMPTISVLSILENCFEQ